nr:hypothetical protein KV8917_160079 [Klebsiella variicola]
MRYTATRNSYHCDVVLSASCKAETMFVNQWTALTPPYGRGEAPTLKLNEFCF